jgi:hypothetical protein
LFVVSVWDHQVYQAGRFQRDPLPKLVYKFTYKRYDDDEIHSTTGDERRLAAFDNGFNAAFMYWFGAQPHRCNLNFVRNLLQARGPQENQALWGLLPHEETAAILFLHDSGNLHLWTPNMTDYVARLAVADELLLAGGVVRE